MPIERAWDVDTAAKFAEMMEEIKAGIIEVAEEELVPGVVALGEKIPFVKNRRIVDLNPSTWATRLKSPRHKEGTGENEVQKVHSFLVGFGGITSVNEDNTTGGKSFTLRFLIDSYYEDEIGTDQDNPEKRHADEVHRLCYVLWMSRVLRRPGLVKRIVEFTERRGFAKMGDNVTRESLAELTVDLNAVPMIRP